MGLTIEGGSFVSVCCFTTLDCYVSTSYDIIQERWVEILF